jgi:2-amino-4-hydroxy-6-hydroxymethyldihydropteridine diphosphokinase
MRDAVTAFVALGANLGDPVAALRGAFGRLQALPHTQLVRHSSLYRTAPVDAGGPDYVNAVAEVTTRLDAPSLLRELQAVETEAGRTREFRHAPRTLDLDLLLYGGARIDSAGLQVPHPRMRERAFVLVPLAEIAPQLVAAGDLASVTAQAIQRL